MAKPGKYAIHADFLHFPTFNFSFNAVILTLLNVLLRVERYLRQRRQLAQATRHEVVSASGSPVEVLQFNAAARGETVPAVVYFHGGAFVLTYASSHINAVSRYARGAQCTVFLVDYRLAQRAPFPGGHDDCCEVLRWVGANAAELGVDPDRIALMGDSAGGGFAATVSQWVQDRRRSGEPGSDNIPAICAQVLIYPVVDQTCSTASATGFHDVPMWNGVSNRAMWAYYLRDFSGQATPPYAAAATRESLAGLPPAYVETAEYDPLRDEGIAYAERLEQAGVDTKLCKTRFTVHGFDTVFSSAVTRHWIERRILFLRDVFYR